MTHRDPHILLPGTGPRHRVSAGADLFAVGVLQLQSPQLREAGEGLPAPVPNPRQCWPSEGVRRGLYLFKMGLFYVVGIEVIVGFIVVRGVKIAVDGFLHHGSPVKRPAYFIPILVLAWSSATTALR